MGHAIDGGARTRLVTSCAGSWANIVVASKPAMCWGCLVSVTCPVPSGLSFGARMVPVGCAVTARAGHAAGFGSLLVRQTLCLLHALALIIRQLGHHVHDHHRRGNVLASSGKTGVSPSLCWIYPKMWRALDRAPVAPRYYTLGHPLPWCPSMGSALRALAHPSLSWFSAACSSRVR